MSLYICIQGRVNGPSQLSRGLFFIKEEIFPKGAKIRLMASYFFIGLIIFFPKELMKAMISFYSSFTAFHQGFVVDVLWEATEGYYILD